MSETLYVVFGEDGEYSDWNTWPVAAYRDEAMAQQHVENAAAAARLRRDLRQPAARDVLDRWDSRGNQLVLYSLTEVELRDALPDAPLEQMQEGLRRGKSS